MAPACEKAEIALHQTRELSKEQAAVLRAVLKGQSIFFTGSYVVVGQSGVGEKQGALGWRRKGP